MPAAENSMPCDLLGSGTFKCTGWDTTVPLVVVLGRREVLVAVPDVVTKLAKLEVPGMVRGTVGLISEIWKLSNFEQIYLFVFSTF